MKEQRAETRFDIHQHVTNQIVAAIEAGAGEFRLPWHRVAGSVMRPVNVASKKPYQGVNILTLWAAGDAAGYEAGTWGTYKQWAEAGAQVRKGEKSAYIVFYKEITVASDESDDDEIETRLFARATPVFAAEQVDCAPLLLIDSLKASNIGNVTESFDIILTALRSRGGT